MSHDAAERPVSRVPRYRLLEQLTATVLLAVVAGLGWIILAAYVPDWPRLAWANGEVIIFLMLLAVALVLVSIVALLHTADEQPGSPGYQSTTEPSSSS
jgi:hypothetical protein